MTRALRDAEANVVLFEVAHDRAEMAWLRSQGKRPVEREQLFQIYMLASNKLANALTMRDKLRAQQGRHPYMNLVGS